MSDLDGILEELADPDKHMTIEQCRERLQQINRCWSDSYCDCHKQLLAERILEHYDALRAAAGKVTCARCANSRIAPPYPGVPCPSCADLRALVTKGE